MGHFFKKNFTQFRENQYGSEETFIKPAIFQENYFYSLIYHSTQLFNYTQWKITHLSRPQPNVSFIGEGCNSLGKKSLASLVGNHWATGELWRELVLGEGMAYKLSFVPAQGEFNIADDS